MKLVGHFESLAASVWHRLHDAHALGVPQGETGLTDHVLLELARARTSEISIVKTPGTREKDTGTDWEWWIGSTQHGWLHYAIQAKRIDVSTQRYNALTKEHDGRRQIDVLRAYATQNLAIPAYCLFNHAPSPSPIHWHCGLTYDSPQLGCSIASLASIESAIGTHGGKTFSSIHAHATTRPWRCLVRCERFIGAISGLPELADRSRGELLAHFGFPVVVHPSLPSWVLPTDAGDLGSGFSDSDKAADAVFDARFYSRDVRNLPYRIVVIDVSDSLPRNISQQR